jgi:hypothetical protein
MKEFVENRGRQDGTGPPDKYCRHFLTVGTQPHLSNIDIVAGVTRTLQTLVEIVAAPKVGGSRGAGFSVCVRTVGPEVAEWFGEIRDG